MSRRLDWATDGADWPLREHSRFVDAGGLRWHVQQAPPVAVSSLHGSPVAERPRLLLVHGTGASTHSWAGLVGALGGTVDWLAVDLPGHAFTSTPPASMLGLPGTAAVLADLLDVLGWQPTLAVGHSAGAAIVARMALDGRLAARAIASINGAFVPFGGVAAPLLSPLARLMYAAKWVPRLIARRAADPAVVRRLVAGTGSMLGADDRARYGLLMRCPAHSEAALAMMAHWDLRTLPQELPRLPMPLHLLAAAGDLAVPPRQARRIAARLPRATLTVLPGVGHLAHEEAPRLVVNWLRTLELPDSHFSTRKI